jgi:hypothetical protein
MTLSLMTLSVMTLLLNVLSNLVVLVFHLTQALTLCIITISVTLAVSGIFLTIFFTHVYFHCLQLRDYSIHIRRANMTPVALHTLGH